MGFILEFEHEQIEISVALQSINELTEQKNKISHQLSELHKKIDEVATKLKREKEGRFSLVFEVDLHSEEFAAASSSPSVGPGKARGRIFPVHFGTGHRGCQKFVHAAGFIDFFRGLDEVQLCKHRPQ